MGICASVQSPVHDDSFGHENAVYYKDSISPCIIDQSAAIGSTYSHEGSKGLNQDTSILFQGYGTEEGAFGGVFDGHGENGHVVSTMVRNRLPSLLLNQRNALSKITSPVNGKQNGNESGRSLLKWKEACVSAFKVLDKEIKLIDNVDCSTSGTTAVVVVRQGDELVIANLGDSRAVLGTRAENGVKAVQLTTDLKPSVPAEAERIRKCNGRVLALKEESHIQRVWLPNVDSPGLAMSRAFGDFLLKNHGVIATPEVSFHHISTNDQFLVLASDGIWDVLTNDQVMNIVCSAPNEQMAAKAVVDAASNSWKKRFPNSKRDDCTALCLFLQK